MAKGEFLGFLDCDDAYLPDKVETCIKFLNDNKNYRVVHTAANFVDSEGNTVGTYSHARSKKMGWISGILILKNYICNSTPLIRRECIKKVGNFDESFFTPADWDLMIRISEQYRIGYIDQPLTRYLVAQNYMFDHLELSQKEELQVLEKTFSRSNGYGLCLQKRAYSDLHLRYAQAYILKNDTQKIKKEFVDSLRAFFLNYQTLGLMLYFIFGRKRLEKELREKILRLT